MHTHLQGLVVFLVVAGAAFFLVRRMVRSAQGHGGGGCSKCACGEGEKKAGA